MDTCGGFPVDRARSAASVLPHFVLVPLFRTPTVLNWILSDFYADSKSSNEPVSGVSKRFQAKFFWHQEWLLLAKLWHDTGLDASQEKNVTRKIRVFTGMSEWVGTRVPWSAVGAA